MFWASLSQARVGDVLRGLWRRGALFGVPELRPHLLERRSVNLITWSHSAPLLAIWFARHVCAFAVDWYARRAFQATYAVAHTSYGTHATGRVESEDGSATHFPGDALADSWTFTRLGLMFHKLHIALRSCQRCCADNNNQIKLQAMRLAKDHEHQPQSLQGVLVWPCALCHFMIVAFCFGVFGRGPSTEDPDVG